MRASCLAACLVAASSLAACGGATSNLFLTTSDDGGVVTTSDASTHDDAGHPLSHPIYAPGCPASPPSDGSPCNAGFGLTCEYGSDTHCTAMATCDSEGTSGSFVWFVTQSDPSCTGNAPSCPATFADAHAGKACPLDDTCTYPEGRCACGACATAGASEGTQWDCQRWVTPAGCPEPRPLLGTACSQEGQACGYGAACCAAVDVGPTMLCQGGYWVAGGDPCDCAGIPACGQ